MTHIHLVAPDFREDKRPTKLVSNALDLVAEQSRWSFKGAQAEKKARITDYNMHDMFNSQLQQKIDRNLKGKEEPFKYKEGFLSELETFVKTNYDKSEFELDFKQLAKQRKERERQEMQA